MLLKFELFGEDEESIHLDPFAVTSIHEHDLNGVLVATIHVDWGDNYRVRDDPRRAAEQINRCRALLFELAGADEDEEGEEEEEDDGISSPHRLLPGTP